jgi:hypothetical protein
MEFLAGVIELGFMRGGLVGPAEERQSGPSIDLERGRLAADRFDERR